MNTYVSTLTSDTTPTSTDTREQWLTNAAHLILDELVLPADHELEKPDFRVSVGFPAGSRAGSKHKAIGQCFPRSMSADAHNEIFIHPELGGIESLRILDILTHELIHAVDDCQSGHKGRFATLAKACGLEGKMTATTASAGLEEYLQTIIDSLGEIPHQSIDYSNVKKQPVRNLKVFCNSCDFSFRTSQKNILLMTSFDCLACGDSNAMEIEVK